MKHYLATVFPPLARVRLPISRDQIYLLFMAVQEIALALECYLTHSLNGTIRFREWIPIWYGPLAAVMLVVAFVLSRRDSRLALGLAVTALGGSIVVGSLGTYFHIVRAIRPFAAAGERITLDLLVWGPPTMAPPFFVLVGAFGLVALCGTKDQDRGALGRPLARALPLTNDRLYFLLTCLGILLATVSSVLDHMRGGFDNPWVWVPTLSGIFGAVVAAVLGMLETPSRADLITYVLAMCILLAIGPLGVVFHVLYNLGAGNAIVIERFLRGAPFLAPMLFANMGLLGLLLLLGPAPQS
jgi:hypothetical protein